ncbi:pyruvate ferredoxin oxidoreductase gamma subunit [Fontibacillus panacisegetis]|uniref:Pyruvate ferredoxin oxidoreductase gamma subunit n=1 Tax=Fontibacillus panacisegetis TaxID=670482 RepID=A0A1G7KCC2_9BACL|nr:2-oxoacid:acceptor oxidoreductase family protein [Fontibacillus panacisegetis]SDF34845.1 pyruvate ferredoxin oxidoreductase gamma subunit [Fontibacillus panacisegetis]
MGGLPLVNKLGFYEIRLEAIGGMGANLAGKMLAEAGVNGSGLNGVSFSSYGSEKKGSPVKAHIRFCELTTQIRDTSSVEHPHMVGIFHEALAKTVHVTSGIGPDSIVLVNSTKAPSQLMALLDMQGGKIAAIDATGIALKEKNRVNMAMLGALFKICPFLDPQAMKDIVTKSLGAKYPQAIESAHRTFDRGYEEVVFEQFTLEDNGPLLDFKHSNISSLGYENQPIGGMITNPGGNYLKDLSISRSGMIPSYDPESCINCAGCDNVCPDMCFVWEERTDRKGRSQIFLQGIDYQYCKGCLKCVQACPTSALSSIKEKEGYADKYSVKHRFDLAAQF